jgi:DNA-binding FrmR family transcriptional regulator
MAHLHLRQKALLARVRRIKGQIDSIERAIAAADTSDNCSPILHTIAACRGALGGLMVEVLDGHVRHHVLDDTKDGSSPAQQEAAEELLSVIRSYVK